MAFPFCISTVVPTGLIVIAAYPALKRWAIGVGPYGTGFFVSADPCGTCLLSSLSPKAYAVGLILYGRFAAAYPRTEQVADKVRKADSSRAEAPARNDKN